jgi:hypothetical protein
MVLSLVKKLAGMLGPDPKEVTGQEVSLGACDLTDADWAVCRKLRVGEELGMEERDGRVYARRGERTAGALCGDEAARASALLGKSADVVCRVSSVNAGEKTARVRLFIRM